MKLIRMMSLVKTKNIYIVLLLTLVLFNYGKKSVYAVTVEDVRHDIKCPDHDRPEILSLIDKLVKEGKTKDDIMDAVAENFGEEVFSVTREKKIGIIPYLIPTFIMIIAFIIVFVYIKKWIKKGEKINLRDKEMVEASNDITDYNKRFIEEYETFKKED